MLFYTQIKREFSPASWKRGQVYFRDRRVTDVKLDGDTVTAKIRGKDDAAYETSITMARGTIFASKCSCPAHRQYETHCKHVAALAIWVVERGSLLRSKVNSAQHGVAPIIRPLGGGTLGYSGPPARDEVVLAHPQRAAADGRLRKLLQAYPRLALSRFIIRKDLKGGLIVGRDPEGNDFNIPITEKEATALAQYCKAEAASRPGQAPMPGEAILYVRGLFQSRVLTGLVVESAIRYFEPQSKTMQIVTLSYLTKQRDPGFWTTTQGALIYVPPVETLGEKEASFIQRLETTKVIYQGQQALENLARLLTHRNRNEMIFESTVNVPVETVPLKVEKMKIGSKPVEGEKARRLSYEWGNGQISFTSEQLEELAKLGRLSNRYVWANDRIYQFEVSLNDLQAYANRSGVAAHEIETEESPTTASPYGTVHDDEAHPLHPIAAFRLSLELGVSAMDVDPEWAEYHDWLKIFEKKRIPNLPSCEYGFDLREYQKNGLSWLWSLYHRGLSGLLADDMGLGKTHQVLAFLTTLYVGGSSKPMVMEKEETAAATIAAPVATAAAPATKAPAKKTLVKKKSAGGKSKTVSPPAPVAKAAAPAPKTKVAKPKSTGMTKPSLVVAPTSVIAAWVQKLKKYDTGLQWHVFHGAGRKLPERGVDVVLTTYGILHREEILRNREWHVVILDEAQAIKNASTISSRAARALKGDFRIAMTGTPVENQAADLWSLIEFLLPGYLGTLPRFRRLYGWGREIPSEVQAQALKRLVSPFLLRRTKAKVLTELPEKTEEVVPCKLTTAQRKAYRACLDSEDANNAREALKKEGAKVDYANILSLLTRLKQICDHPQLADLTAGRVKQLETVDPSESGKWETLEELVNEALGSNLKIVVFTQYLGMMDLIGHFLQTKGVGYTDLRGDTPDRAGRLDKFANDPECRVFICSLLAGGLGIDLTSASVCIHFDRWWNPAKENQATDRLHRFGQTRGVQVFKLQIPGTVEDRISQIIESKVALSGALIEESSVGLKSFSRKELLELLSPVPTAESDGLEDSEIVG